MFHSLFFWCYTTSIKNIEQQIVYLRMLLFNFTDVRILTFNLMLIFLNISYYKWFYILELNWQLILQRNNDIILRSLTRGEYFHMFSIVLIIIYFMIDLIVIISQSGDFKNSTTNLIMETNIIFYLIMIPLLFFDYYFTLPREYQSAK